MLVIRMARGGRVKKPIYTIVAANSRSPRNGRFIEKLGQYDPKAEKELIDVNVASISAYVNKGAVMSDTVRTLLKKNNIKLD
ncbi:MAG: 30S ribosomal protein S16 [Deltaproteobacteria bacterium]|nr:MAG: 30S ribosomal protein S16 [Deltaproteobacteria bacterium]